VRQPPRKLTLLASIDVAGYTRLVQHDERGTLAELNSCARSSSIRCSRAAGIGGGPFRHGRIYSGHPRLPFSSARRTS